VGNRVGDYSNYLTDGVNAVLFDGDGVEECTAALIRTLALNTDKRKKMRQAAVTCAVREFDYRNWTERISEYIR